MAKQGEDQRDQLFDVSLGDGLIEIDETPAVEKPAAEDNTGKEKPTEIPDSAINDDGTFEIPEFVETPEEKPSDEDGTFIENTDKPEETKTKTPSKDDGSSDSSSSSPYLAFARDRANEGVFLDFNEEDWATLKERNDGDESAALKELSQISVREQVRQGVENFKGSLTPEERTLYEAKEKGLPLDEYSVAKRNHDRYSKFKEDDLVENEKLQEEVVSKVLELRGFSPEEIKEEVEGYKALENLEAKAKKALPMLPKTFKGQMTDIEKNAESQEQARQDGVRQRVARMKRTVETTPEIIPGIKLTKPTKAKIMDSMMTPVAKDAQGNPLNPVMATRSKNPDAFEMMIHYYHSLGLFNIDDDGQMKPDFSKISKTAKTKATDEFRSAFESKDKPIAGKTVVPKQNEDELDDFEKAFRRL